MDYARVAETLASQIPSPATVETRKVPAAALFLTILLVGLVPTIAVPMGLTGLGLIVLVVGTGILYGGVLVFTDSVFEGLCSAVLVLATFKANIPTIAVMRGGRIGAFSLDIMFVDVVAIPLALLALYWVRPSLSLPSIRRAFAGYALAGVAVWATLAAVVGNGPSTIAAAIFAVIQLRHILLFVIGVFIVRYIGIRNVVYSLLIAVAGHLFIALVEVINRGAFGLSYLGDSSGKLIDLVTLGPVTFQASMYAGGFTGTSRVLIALLLLTLPIAVGLLIGRSRRIQVVGTISILCGVFLIRVGQTDSGTMALVLSMGVMFVALVALPWMDGSVRQTESFIGAANALLAVGSMLFLHIVPHTVNRPEDPSPPSTDAGVPGGTVDVGSGASDPINAVNTIVSYIPVGLNTFGIRIRQYAAAIDLAVRYPLFGLGGANFPLIAVSYGLPRPMEIHGVYFSYLAEIGFPGLALFLAAIAAIFVTAIKHTISVAPTDRPLWAGIVCGLIGFFAYSFWTTVHSSVAYLTFWVLSGAIVGTGTDVVRN